MTESTVLKHCRK